MSLITNDFENFLKISFLQKDDSEKKQNNTYVVKNKIYNIKFFHDFMNDKEIEENLKNVKEKYARRIKMLYSDITKPTLFIRYIMNENEYRYIINYYNDIKKTIKKFHTNNDIIFICNEDWMVKKFPGKIFKRKNDNDDSVARHFVKNQKIKKYIKRNVNIKIKDKWCSKYKYAKFVLKNKFNIK